MAELTVPQTMAPKRHPGEIAIDRIWRFFCSVRAAIWEVSILAVMVLVGTLRGSSVPNTIAELFPFTEPLVDRWYAYDIFGSLPFAGILALLSVAIAVCTINRVPGIWSSITNPTVLTSRGFIASADVSATLTPTNIADDPLEQLRSHLKARKYRVIEQELNGDTHLYADKNRFGKLGTFPFHLALIMILVGGIVGARYGIRDDEFIVAEGATEQLLHGTSLSVHLEDFQDSYNQLGAP
ncbi:MAG: cytochrome c biogenesis protein ResB, partial [Actinomycetota bacterium]|nr:cytochrome c biogenesis protein ResB [Actinomycetota bacterium]